MARQTVEIEGEDERSDTEKVAAAYGVSEDDADDLLRGLEEVRNLQGIVFQVYRTEPKEREGFCNDYPASIFTIARLSKDFGPGVYRVRIKGEGGRFRPGGGTIKIAAPPEGVTPNAQPETSSVQDMLALLKADREKSSERLKEWAAILAPIAAPMLANIFTQKRETVADMVGALAALKQLEPAPPKAPDALAEIDKVSALLERVKTIQGDATSSTGATWVDVIRDGLASVKDLIASGAVARMIPARAAGAQPLIPLVQPQPVLTVAPGSAPSSPASPSGISPASTGVESTPGISTPPGQEGNVGLLALLPWLRDTLITLTYQASRNKDPNLYAEVTLDNLPDGADVRELLKFIEAPDWWQNLQQFAPQVIPYAGWFQEFRTALIKEIKKLIVGTPETDEGSEA